ncbi:MAG: type II and III secretion system protein family protein [Alphaproteobacteria bacterium]|nr:type II and III secretion system protein family protein [Alphaproteobacteria bacterium]
MTKLVCLAVLMFVSVAGSVPPAFASKTDLVTVASDKQRNDPTLILTQGMAEIVDVGGPVSDIMVANPSIVDVVALQSNRLYVVGMTLGSTNVIAVDAQGNIISRLNVHVKFDDIVLQNLLDKLFPDEEIHIHSLTDQVVLTGRVSTPAVSQQVAEVVAHYVGELQDSDFERPEELIMNMLKVAGEHQVMLKVKIVEASRGVLRELGLETDYAESEGIANLTGGFASALGVGLTRDPLGVGQVIYDTGPNGFGPLSFILRALEEDALVNTLAEPNLTAVSGETAGFLAGGEIPIPTGRDRDGNIVIEYHDFGVSLNFRPVVMNGDLISLQLQSEVSSVSTDNGFVSNQINIPAFTVRRAETTVELPSGGSLVIAGLLQSDVTKTLTQLPGVANIPVLGDLVSSKSFQRDESELIVIVTAVLVSPYADKTMARSAVPAAGGALEKSSEKHTPKPVSAGSHPLAKAFADNVKKTYRKASLSSSLFTEDQLYGYLID